jgi:hypothetical protein
MTPRGGRGEFDEGIGILASQSIGSEALITFVLNQAEDGTPIIRLDPG